MEDESGIWAALIAAGTILLVLGSLALWIRLFQRRALGLQMVPNRFRNASVQVPRVAVWLTWAWVTTLLLSQLMPFIVRSDQTSTHPEPTPAEVLQAIQTMLGVESAVVVLILVSLMLGIRSPVQWVKLGFRTDEEWGQLREGALGFVAAVLPLSVMMIGISLFKRDEEVHPLLKLLTEMDFGAKMYIVFVAAAIMAPLMEELLFRVILQTWLTNVFSTGTGILLTAIIFAAVHGFPDSLAIFVLALILGVLFERRRSYLAVVTLHALFNTYNLLATLVWIR